MNDYMVERQREIIRRCGLGDDCPIMELGWSFWTPVVEKLLGRIEALERRNDEVTEQPDLKAAADASDSPKMTIVEVYRPTAHPLSEWNEFIGDVLWWKFPDPEAPYVGTPNDLGYVVEVWTYDGGKGPRVASRTTIGGWPGYHTHWTPLPPVPREPEL